MASLKRSAVTTTTTTTSSTAIAANLKLSLLRSQFRPPRRDLCPVGLLLTSNRIWSTSIDVHNKRRLLLILPPRNVRSAAFAVDVSGHCLRTSEQPSSSLSAPMHSSLDLIISHNSKSSNMYLSIYT
ncbi:hypothetical protein L6452_13885 [Arctium lappa]|uniref:Uncharacterized protein n=1 Tax=Arctium lappa TaxID=4217 RepID=A0ACB9CJG8_ARCLA|nr:hypothetical protein L6452_13885 [Arctium lappa]